LMSKKLKKIYSWNFIDIFFGSKTTSYLSQGLRKGRPSYKRSLQLSEVNIQHLKHEITYFFLLFVIFALLDLDMGRSGFRVWIRIHWPDWIRIQFGSGSATLISGIQRRAVVSK
jgi:hypothetical protein